MTYPVTYLGLAWFGATMDIARTVGIISITRDSSRHATIEFEDANLAGYQPGQFVMVWVPGVDELPMALWGGHGGRFRILVEAKGDGSRALCALKAGDVIGVRGPYGRPFVLRGKRVLVVVGGTGTSPLVPFCQRHADQAEIDVVIGARSKEFVLVQEAYEESGVRVHVSTDDGSLGFHGRAPDLARRLMDSNDYDDVLACGPERMMRAVFDEARKRGIGVQASLERWMKCAVGICDACLVDDVRLCRDGPVLDGDVLARLKDFGNFEREPSGLKVPIH